MDGVADEDSGNRADPSAVWIPKDPRAAEPGGLGSEGNIGATFIPRRRISAKTKAETKKADGRAAGRTGSDNGSESGLEFGFCGGPVDRWAAISSLDDCGCVHKREFGDPGGASIERNRRGQCAKPTALRAKSTEDAILR